MVQFLRNLPPDLSGFQTALHHIQPKCLIRSYTMYWKNLTKGKFGEFDESGSNCQNKTNPIYIMYNTISIFFIDLLYNIIRGALMFQAANLSNYISSKCFKKDFAKVERHQSFQIYGCNDQHIKSRASLEYVVWLQGC